ncbi:MAG: hypothetical protein CMO97_05160 [Woeseia sp.]|nr:hypothetical protein [Woeseia sp.]
MIIELETVIVDPQADYQNQEDPLEYVYATVLWPDGYTTQEVDYELWTPEEAFEYSEKKINIFKEQKK